MIIRSKNVYPIFALLLIILFTAVAGCDDMGFVYPPEMDCSITIKGLENFSTDNGKLTVLLPAPIYNGSAVVETSHAFYSRIAADGQYSVIPPKDTNLSVIAVNGSPMIAFNESMTDAYTTWGYEEGPIVHKYREKITKKPERSFDSYYIYHLDQVLLDNSTRLNNSSMLENILSDSPLSPKIGDTDTEYTVWHKDARAKNFTSYVYIDDSLKPLAGGNHSIEIEMTLTASEARMANQTSKSYYFYVHEIIPGGVTGFIPVKAQYLEYWPYYDPSYKPHNNSSSK